MRYLAIDLGDKRTGLAVGDDETGLVSPAGTIELPREQQGEQLLAALCDAATEHEVGIIVLGLPLNMDDTEGPRAALSRELGARLASACALPIQYQDERLTSFAADAHMARSGRTHKQKKALRDQLAAVEILKDHLSNK